MSRNLVTIFYSKSNQISVLDKFEVLFVIISVPRFLFSQIPEYWTCRFRFTLDWGSELCFEGLPYDTKFLQDYQSQERPGSLRKDTQSDYDKSVIRTGGT